MKLFFSGSPTESGLSSVSWTPFVDQILNWCRLLTVVGVGFPVGKSLRSLLDLGCPTCINTWLFFTLSHITNLTSLPSSLRKILENLYCFVEERNFRASREVVQHGLQVRACGDKSWRIRAGIKWSMRRMLVLELPGLGWSWRDAGLAHALGSKRQRSWDLEQRRRGAGPCASWACAGQAGLACWSWRTGPGWSRAACALGCVRWAGGAGLRALGWKE
ncbi:unnamed protein product [Prunus armeniaca]